MPSLGLMGGKVVETATWDGNGVVDGSSLFDIISASAVDNQGQCLEVRFAGCSVFARSIEMDSLFPPGVGAPYCTLVHICTTGRQACAFVAGQRHVLHIDMLRSRARSKIRESWARQSVLRPIVIDAGLAGVPLQGGGNGDPGGGGEGGGEVAKLRKALDKAEKDLTKEKKRRVSGRLFAAAAAAGDRREGDELKIEMKDEDEDDSLALFQQASSRNGSTMTGTIQTMGRAQPGNLYLSGLEEVKKFISAREGASEADQDSALPPKLVSYLTSIFHGSHPIKECGVRNSRELRTLAEAIDALGYGQLPQLGDLLMQRFKAVQTSVTDGGWHLAKRLELIPEEGDSVVSFEEKRLAARDELLHLKLDEARTKAKEKAR